MRVDDPVLGGHLTPDALARGLAYARSGRVLQVEVDPENAVVEGRVRGSRPRPYEVVVEFHPATGTVEWSHCSCPLGGDCKHVAALLIAGRQQLPTVAQPPVRTWERDLAPLLAASAPVEVSTAALALRVEPTTPDPGQPLEIRCRPVRPGKAGRWVQQGASWNDLEQPWRANEFDSAQRAALAQLRRVASEPDRYYGYYGQTDWLTLTGTPPLLWHALADLAAAGVALLPGGRGPGTVQLAARPADLMLDVQADPEGGALVVSPRLDLAIPGTAARRVGFIGSPAHGVVVETTGPGAALVLAPLPRSYDDAALSWLERVGPFTVPGEDRDRFLTEYAPRLRRAVPLVSSDASVTFPEASPPRLALGLRHGEPGEVALAWSVGYRMGERTVRFDPQDPGDDPGIRDRAAERELWAGLPVQGTPWAGRLGLGPPAVHPVRRLTGLDAAVFCAEVVPGLAAAGVEVTQTGEQRDYRRSDSAPEVALRVTENDDRSDWFDLGVEVRLDQETVPFDLLFAALARGEEHLVLPSGTYFALDRPELHRLAELIAEARLLQDQRSTGLRINARQPSLWEDLAACGVVEQQAARWRRTVEALAAADDAEQVEVPTGLRAKLRPYQREGYAWLWRLWTAGVGGILADDMGLGKTLQALALVCAVHERQPGAPFLVVAPTSVVSNWAAETARFAPGLRVAAIDQTARKRGVPLAELAGGADLVITSYTLLRLDAEDYQAQEWRGLVLDEAQFVKNHQAKTYGALRRLGVDFTVAMTGTPLENSLMDLWSMLSLSAPGMFPSPERFTEFYRTPIEKGQAPERLELLRRRVRPVLLRRTKEMVAADLPAKQEQVLEVDLHARHARIYQTHLQRERQKVLHLIDDLDENRFTVLRSLTVLRQLSLEAALVDASHEGVPSAKLDLLAEMLPELVAEGHRALVFSQFTRFLRRIADRLDAAGVPYSYLDGRTRNRGRVIEEFRSGGNGVFLISLKAGGFGLNLTEADYCFVCDPWWNPAAEAQAVDRAHRIGQTRPVMVYRLVSRDTIEEKVMALKARKEALFSSVMSDDGLPSGALSSEDIRALLAS